MSKTAQDPQAAQPQRKQLRGPSGAGGGMWEDLSCNVHFRIVSHNSILPGVTLWNGGGGALSMQAEAGRIRTASGSRSRTGQMERGSRRPKLANVQSVARQPLYL
jgi:hypothetical protein